MLDHPVALNSQWLEVMPANHWFHLIKTAVMVHSHDLPWCPETPSETHPPSYYVRVVPLSLNSRLCR